jgi:hypothetical protein
MMASGMATDFADSRVIFVYNAQSGLFSALSDYVHKIISPDTYDCQLCAVTYGNLGMRSTWAGYVKALPAKVIFTYKDKLIAEPPVMRNAELPAAFVIRDNETKPAITAKEFNACQSEEALIALCTEKLEPLLI